MTSDFSKHLALDVFLNPYYNSPCFKNYNTYDRAGSYKLVKSIIDFTNDKTDKNRAPVNFNTITLNLYSTKEKVKSQLDYQLIWIMNKDNDTIIHNLDSNLFNYNNYCYFTYVRNLKNYCFLNGINITFDTSTIHNSTKFDYYWRSILQ